MFRAKSALACPNLAELAYLFLVALAWLACQNWPTMSLVELAALILGAFRHSAVI